MPWMWATRIGPPQRLVYPLTVSLNACVTAFSLYAGETTSNFIQDCKSYTVHDQMASVELLGPATQVTQAVYSSSPNSCPCPIKHVAKFKPMLSAPKPETPNVHACATHVQGPPGDSCGFSVSFLYLLCRCPELLVLVPARLRACLVVAGVFGPSGGVGANWARGSGRGSVLQNLYDFNRTDFGVCR